MTPLRTNSLSKHLVTAIKPIINKIIITAKRWQKTDFRTVNETEQHRDHLISLFYFVRIRSVYASRFPAPTFLQPPHATHGLAPIFYLEYTTPLHTRPHHACLAYCFQKSATVQISGTASDHATHCDGHQPAGP